MLFRIQPAGPVQAYKTYGLRAPVATHWREASCAEVDCQAYAFGWITRCDEVTELGARQADYIRRQSGRRFTQERTPVGLTIFTFEAGQKCFAGHKVPLDRDPVLYVRGGDWRGNTGMLRNHVRADDWVDDFATHQQRLADRVARG